MSLEYYTTNELKTHLNEVYDKLKVLAQNDEVYTQLNVDFSNVMPHGLEGTCCYTDKDGYHYLYVERGSVQRHDITQSLFKITYWVLESQVFSMAVEYERKHRIRNQDSRRIIFKKQLQYFEVIGDRYILKAENDINNTLKDYPFQDELYK